MAYLRDTALLGRWEEGRIDRAAKSIGAPETVDRNLARPQGGSRQGLRALVRGGGVRRGFCGACWASRSQQRRVMSQ